MKITTVLRNTALDAILALLDGGTGILEIRTGSAPTNAGDALSGTVLATIGITSDPFAAASGGSAAKQGTWEDTSADASGTAGYAVLRKSGDTTGADNTVPRFMLTVTGLSGGGEVEVQNTSIVATQSLTVSTFAIAQPAS